ncbi:MAG TPA: MBL fold metallo-hydrolase [Kofleriaceae bacterium]|nr:MBL fold metallo-hydrolase [Kofleriaceae bacterium]
MPLAPGPHVQVSFYGAIDTVTGSRYLVEHESSRVLVDSGLFQGPKKLRERNWAELPFDLATLDAVVLTHAHIDHAGYLPRLHKLGYQGPVYCTPGTRDLLQLLLPDAGHLQEEEAEHANRWGYSKHHPALPLYTRAEAEQCLALLQPVEFHAPFEPAAGFTARYSRAGHIIGSACVALAAGGTSITFSGDVGRQVDPIMKPPEPLAATEHLVVESTYGDRRHSSDDIAAALARVITETVERGGVIVVPAFAVGRAQHLLHLLATLRTAGRIPSCPIYLDSPMAIDATNLFCGHVGEHALDEAQCMAMCRVAKYSQTADDSKAIDRSGGPMIVISASGMCTGGRVLHHLRRFLPDERSTILFVGYQAAGTRGRSLVDGAAELKLLGQYVPVRAKIVQLDGLSAHGDYAELIAWLRQSQLAPRRVFVTHGEPAAADAFRRRLAETFGWDVRVPDAGETVRL